MKFDPPLQTATLIKRYKRFMADVELSNGDVLTLHCPNTGSMKNCAEPGSQVWFSDSGNPKRKYPHTWELVSVEGNFVAGINTNRANALVKEALENNVVPALSGYDELRSEVKYGEENSRIDLLLEFNQASAKPLSCYVEVKNLTLGEGKDGFFPDAVTERGRKHLRELVKMVEQGHRAVLFFCVQHTGVVVAKPAQHIDPKYAETIREAVAAGVEVMAWQCVLNESEARIEKELPVDLT